ncbi:MAG TPA: MtrB/PioB family decaheme-associated outer membrane protein [Rhodopseudomonas sp.]|uniref:MtrB/PioB family decaheme-associated outer membrane protein n=1 Tax=Rhodopseudomonas sp. TaxID=1078 RepID=UPI002ED7D776
MSAALAVATVAPLNANAADPPAPAPDVEAAAEGYDYSGEFDVGGRVFVKRPPKSSAHYVTPSSPNAPANPDPNNRSKFEEYGAVPPGLFAEYLRMTLQSKDGLYASELRADNIGNNNQRYIVDASKAGEHYLTLVWDQIPHLYNTSALSIWNGVGSNNLTTNVTIPGSGLSVVAPATTTTAAQRAAVSNALNGKVNTIDVGIQRDKAAVAYRWTPDQNWDIKASYSHEKREGIQTSGVAIGGLAGTGLQQLQAPRPIDDTTQIAKVSGQYFGPTPWGGHFNVQLGGGASLFENNFNSFTVQNPFYDAGNPRLFPASARVSLAPSNQAYNTAVTSGVDLPFKTRWNSTLQFTTMRQNDDFMPFTINPSIATFVLPASSLNGEVNTILYNTNATTQWSPDFRSTFRYRIYDNDNQTPELLMPNYVVEDSSATGIAAGVPRRSLSMSYTKQNASEEFQWRPAKWVTLGSSVGWEQWDRTRRDANVTNEFIGRGTADFKIYDVATLRTSAQYAERRYDNYDGLAMAQLTYYSTANLGTNINMRKFDMANRNETKANVFLDISGPSGSIFRDFVITPTAGLRFDDYPDNDLLFGLKKSNTWNAGVDGTYVFKPGTSIQASYLYETFDRFQVGSETISNSVTGLPNATPVTAFASNTHEKVHTIIVAANVELIPGALDFKLGYSISRSNEDWDYSQYGNYALLANAGGAVYSPFPTVRNYYQRLDASLKHTVDPSIVAKLGWTGEVYLKARYIWERNSVDNWQQDLMSPYLYLVDQTLARLIDMGATNPNYNAQYFQLSLNAKW